MNALIVDDSKPVRSILARMLKALRFDCHEAANGEEALALLTQISRPDIVTVNWHMPVMDGIELIKRLRADPSSQGLRLLMVSTEQDQDRIAMALDAGADDFVVKPFTEAAIGQKLIDLGICSVSHVATSVVASRTPIRVLIVDDSLTIRSVLATTLADDPELQVVGTAADGQLGLVRIRESIPDIVLLDVEMPVMDGITMLRELRRIQPRLPVLMFSSLTERGAKAAIEALVAGADDYVAKPQGSNLADVATRIRAEIIPRIKQLVPRRQEAVDVSGGRVATVQAPAHSPRVPRRVRSEKIAAVVVAVSTGGPSALADFLPAFVSRSSVPVLIVQHMPPVFTSHLAQRLTHICNLPVREAQSGHVLAAGDSLLAPGGLHMEVVKTGSAVSVGLTTAAPENSCRPSADVLFRSAAKIWGAGTLAVVLTGMGRDGFQGCEAIVAAGGDVLAQDESTSVVWGMPGHVARAGLADAILPLSQLGVEVSLRLKRRML